MNMKINSIQQRKINIHLLLLKYGLLNETYKTMESTRNNSKLSNDTIIINREPATVCSSEAKNYCLVCPLNNPDKPCYAKNTEKMYENTLIFRLRQMIQWDQLTAEKIVNSILPTIKKALKYKVKEKIDTIFITDRKTGKEIKIPIYEKKLVPIKYLRFNESGDLDTKEDLQKLITIALLLPELQVYGYTHNKDLLYTIANLNIANLNINSSNRKIDGLNYIRVVTKKSDIPVDAKYVCNGMKTGCHNCDYCKINRNATIWFLLHK